MHERGSCRPEACRVSVPDGRERELSVKMDEDSKPSTGSAAVSPTSVCCDRLHISPPTPSTPFFAPGGFGMAARGRPVASDDGALRLQAKLR